MLWDFIASYCGEAWKVWGISTFMEAGSLACCFEGPLDCFRCLSDFVLCHGLTFLFRCVTRA